jgi:leucyl aminopeptidase
MLSQSRLFAALMAVSSALVATAPASARDVEPTSWLVVGSDTWRGFRGPSELLRMDGHGNLVVLVEASTWEREVLSDYIHKNERRCGGYFSFLTREEAEAFLAATPPPSAFVPTYSIDRQPLVEMWLPMAEEPNIRATISSLESFHSRHYLSATAIPAAEWLRDEWQSLAEGRSDVTAELFTNCSGCGGQPSVILTIQGATFPDEIVVMGAHLDSTNGSAGAPTTPTNRSPGADDDASGIAVITEVLRVAMETGYRPDRTVKFMGYAAEEIGLRGSQAIASSFSQANANVYAVWQTDMTNYHANGKPTIEFITDHNSQPLMNFVQQLFDTYVGPSTGYGYTRGASACGYGCSDHASWKQYGFPSMMLSEGGGLSFMSPCYHKVNDSLEACYNNSAIHSLPFARLGLAFLAETAKGAMDPTLLDRVFENGYE